MAMNTVENQGDFMSRSLGFKIANYSLAFLKMKESHCHLALEGCHLYADDQKLKPKDKHEKRHLLMVSKA